MHGHVFLMYNWINCQGHASFLVKSRINSGYGLVERKESLEHPPQTQQNISNFGNCSTEHTSFTISHSFLYSKPILYWKINVIRTRRNYSTDRISSIIRQSLNRPRRNHSTDRISYIIRQSLDPDAIIQRI